MLSALVLLAIALLCVWAGGYAFLIMVVIGCLVLSGEWLAMCRCTMPDWPMFWLPAVIVSAALLTGVGLPWAGLLLVLTATAAAALWAALAASPGSSQNMGPAGGGRRFELAFGLSYFGLAAVALLWLRADPEVGLRNTLFVLVVVWASDVGAYMLGRLIGGPKLAPVISPGKTWSGAAGGLISAVLGATAVAVCASPASVSHVFAPVILLGVISQSGDLFESALKRHFGVKDFGRIIPGHGGLLDRLDALLAVAPVAALLALTVGRGVVLWH